MSKLRNSTASVLDFINKKDKEEEKPEKVVEPTEETKPETKVKSTPKPKRATKTKPEKAAQAEVESSNPHHQKKPTVCTLEAHKVLRRYCFENEVTQIEVISKLIMDNLK